MKDPTEQQLSEDFSSTSLSSGEQERDEVKEIEKMSSRETRLVLILRAIFTVALICTAVIVTTFTFQALTAQQDENFNQAFSQFSSSLIASTIKQQRRMDQSLRRMAKHFTVLAERQNMTWPFVTDPDFELVAAESIQDGNCEVTAMFPFVGPHQVEAWEEFAEANYKEWVRRGHELHYQNLDLWKENSTYSRQISQKDPASGKFLPASGHDVYSPMWLFAPPPMMNGAINLDLMHSSNRTQTFRDMIRYRNYTVSTLVDRYVSRNIVFSKERHEAMHSKLEDSSIEYPHTFQFRPIYETLKDDAPMVGYVGVAFSWDASMRFLLPETTKPLTVVLRNNCKNVPGGQTFTYKIRGKDAIFIGNGDLHDQSYSQTESANLTDIPEEFDVECRYWMVRYVHTQETDVLILDIV